VVGALETWPGGGALGDFLGRGPTMFGRRSGLAMRSTHGAVVSSLPPTRQLVLFGLERLLGRRLLTRWSVVGLTPGAAVSSRSDLGGPMGVQARQREMPGGLIPTLICDVDHVTCRHICVFRVGKLWSPAKSPTSRLQLARPRLAAAEP
jgi:hypothetical protein